MKTRFTGSMGFLVLVFSFAAVISCVRTAEGDESGGASAAPPAPIDAEALVATWQLESFEDDGQSVPTVADGDITLRLAHDGTIGGSSGCNNYRTTFGLGENGSVEFGAMASTMMACRSEIMEQEQRYQRILENASALRLEGDRLSVLDAEGKVALRFARVEPGEQEESPDE